jgi:protein-tyrosine phosphatase
MVSVRELGVVGAVALTSLALERWVAWNVVSVWCLPLIPSFFASLRSWRRHYLDARHRTLIGLIRTNVLIFGFHSWLTTLLFLLTIIPTSGAGLSPYSVLKGCSALALPLFVLNILLSSYFPPIQARTPRAAIVHIAVDAPFTVMMAGFKAIRWPLNRLASPIADGIFLGTAPLLAFEREYLRRELGITHVVNLCAEFPCLNAHYKQLGIQTLYLKWIDFAPPPPDQVPVAAKWIAEAFKSNPDARVFVHCKFGMARSATVVAAFLTAYRDVPLEHVAALVREKRPEVVLRPEHMHRIKAFLMKETAEARAEGDDNQKVLSANSDKATKHE